MNQAPITLNLKQLIIIGGVLFAGIIVMLVIAFLPRTQILLQIAPNSASLNLDGKDIGTVSYDQKLTVSPGDHTLKLSRSEFSTETVTITAKKDKTTNAMIALTPQTDAAWAILRSDPTSVAIFQGYGAKKAVTNQDQVNRANPAYKNLPINTREYYIYLCPSLKNYGDNKKRAICVDLVSDLPAIRDHATAALAAAGIDTTKEEVYTSADSNVRPIVVTEHYAISYHRDLDGHNKPTFAILIISTTTGNARTAELAKWRDQALAALQQAGYKLPNVNIVYVNPELVQFNTSPDISYPAVTA